MRTPSLPLDGMRCDEIGQDEIEKSKGYLTPTGHEARERWPHHLLRRWCGQVIAEEAGLSTVSS